MTKKASLVRSSDAAPWLFASAIVLVAFFAPSYGATQSRIFTFEEEELIVEIELPEAFYILAPSNLNYESVEPEESFLQELFRSVERDPF